MSNLPPPNPLTTPQTEESPAVFDIRDLIALINATQPDGSYLFSDEELNAIVDNEID